MFIDSTSSRHTSTQNLGITEVVIITAWMGLFLMLVEVTVTSEELSNAIALSASY